jgi:hypothetical protein
MLCNSMHRVPHYTDVVEAAARGAEQEANA